MPNLWDVCSAYNHRWRRVGREKAKSVPARNGRNLAWWQGEIDSCGVGEITAGTAVMVKNGSPQSSEISLLRLTLCARLFLYACFMKYVEISVGDI